MRKLVLIATVLMLSGAPAIACEWERSVSTPADQVVMTPVPTVPLDEAAPVVTN